MLYQAGQRHRVAVILNERARGVRPHVVKSLGRIVPHGDLYVSRDLEESRRIARTVVERGYDSVLLGGGDGTFVQCLSDLRGEADRRAQPLPGVGVLRLGTGNALADALGASTPTLDGLAADFRRARRQKPGYLALLEVEGKLSPFAGCGLDAQILDDFAKLGTVLDRFPVTKKLGAGPRYALTVGLRSTPRFVLSQLPEIEVVNTGGPAYRVDWSTGRPIEDEPIEAGRVLYRGRAAIATCSTIPYFGLKMKMFPFCDLMEGRFQLRLSTASAFETLWNLPQVFAGEYRTANLHDYLCESIQIRVERPVPFQIGGDLAGGPRETLDVALASEPIKVVN
jgi:diacylglycerol kinase family enzyme